MEQRSRGGDGGDALSAFCLRRFSRMCSLSKMCPVGVMTGILHGSVDSAQQSKCRERGVCMMHPIQIESGQTEEVQGGRVRDRGWRYSGQDTS